MLFTDDENVYEMLNMVMPIFILEIMFKMMRTALSGVIYGIGYQTKTIYFSAFSHIFVMLLLSYFLMDVCGYFAIWIGPCSASFIMVLTFLMYILVAPWEELAKEASGSRQTLIGHEDFSSNSLIIKYEFNSRESSQNKVL